MSQPATTLEHETAPELPTEYLYLFAAVATIIIALAIWGVRVGTPISPKAADVIGDIGNVLYVIGGIAGCGYLVRSAEARVARQVDRRAVNDDTDEYRRGYAIGFVDGVTGRADAEGTNSATVRSIH